MAVIFLSTIIPNNSSVGWKLLGFNLSINKQESIPSCSLQSSVIQGSKGPKSTIVVGKFIP